MAAGDEVTTAVSAGAQLASSAAIAATMSPSVMSVARRVLLFMFAAPLLLLWYQHTQILLHEHYIQNSSRNILIYRIILREKQKKGAKTPLMPLLQLYYVTLSRCAMQADRSNFR